MIPLSGAVLKNGYDYKKLFDLAFEICPEDTNKAALIAHKMSLFIGFENKGHEQNVIDYLKFTTKA